MMYRSQCEAIRNLPPEQFKAVVCALWDYEMDGIIPEGDPVVIAMFGMAKPLIDRRNVYYENGKKGGRPNTKNLTTEQEEEENKARHSTDYEKWRDAVYQRDGYRCQQCGSDGKIEAHHIKSFTEAPELRFDVSNGITLCPACHRKAHSVKPSNNLNKPVDNLSQPDKTVKDKGERKKEKGEKIKDIGERIKEKEKENTIATIIDHLNQTAGTAYRASSRDTKGHINARLSEGYTVADFITVIDKKTAEWKGTDMEKYLRPATLFGSKFEGYLNQKTTKKDRYSDVDDWVRKGAL